MQFTYGFGYDADTGTLTVTYLDGQGDRVETVSLGHSCPEALLFVRSATGEGVKLVIPNWSKAQADVRLVRVFDLLGPE